MYIKVKPHNSIDKALNFLYNYPKDFSGADKMSKKATSTKKLTNAGSVAVLLSLLGFIAALGGMLLEPVGYFVHNIEFGKDVGLFSGKVWYSYFTGYDKHIIVFLLATAAMFICFAARKHRRIGAEVGSLLTFVSFGTLLASVTTTASGSDGGTLEYTWATVLIPGLDPDMVNFDKVLAVLYYVLPITASGILLILGLLLWIRADVSSFSVECPRNDLLLSSSTPAEKPAPEETAAAIAAVTGAAAAAVEAPKEEPVKEESEPLKDFEKILEPSERAEKLAAADELIKDMTPEEPKPAPAPEAPAPAKEEAAPAEKPAAKSSGTQGKKPQQRQQGGKQGQGAKKTSSQNGGKKSGQSQNRQNGNGQNRPRQQGNKSRNPNGQSRQGGNKSNGKKKRS